MSENTKLYQEIIKKSLIEDHFNNDITSDCCIKDENINFKLIAKEDIFYAQPILLEIHLI